MSSLQSVQYFVKQTHDILNQHLENALQSIISLYSKKSIDYYVLLINSGISAVIDVILQQSPEKIFMSLIEIMFSPNIILRQVIIIICLQFSMIAGIKMGNMLVSAHRTVIN